MRINNELRTFYIFFRNKHHFWLLWYTTQKQKRMSVCVQLFTFTTTFPSPHFEMLNLVFPMFHMEFSATFPLQTRLHLIVLTPAVNHSPSITFLTTEKSPKKSSYMEFPHYIRQNRSEKWAWRINPSAASLVLPSVSSEGPSWCFLVCLRQAGRTLWSWVHAKCMGCCIKPHCEAF